ncbi:condensation domain-containing protein [Leptospira santarosai]|uniref:condensation domain-containing protein n=2 Tax=Leptospira santarosai TaxID=28183 RepID=UPI000248953C|nr:condensation domain-containing protein [Leptospira santarosai]EMM77382.1 condensation domain protein [Leptospira santarosai str. 2000030832]
MKFMYESAPNQVRHWKHFKKFPKSPALNITVAFYLTGNINYSYLTEAIIETVKKNSALSDIPFEKNEKLFFTKSDITNINPEGFLEIINSASEKYIIAKIIEEAARPFAIDRESLTRIKLFCISEQKCILLLNIHHISFDGWAVDLFLKQVSSIYDSNIKNLTPVSSDVGDFAETAAFQKNFYLTKVGLSDLSYWNNELKDANFGIGFPSDKNEKIHDFPKGKMVWAYLSETISNEIKIISKKEGITSFSILLSAFALLLLQESKSSDLLIGIPYVNRLRKEESNLLGFLVNTLPLRFRDPEISKRQFVRDTAKKIQEGFFHQRIPYIDILKQLGPEFESGLSPVFRSMFILQGSQFSRNPFDELECKQAFVSTGAAKYDHTWTIEERKGCFTLDVEWNSHSFSDSYILYLMEKYVSILKDIFKEFPEHKTEHSILNNDSKDLCWISGNSLDDIFSGPILLEDSTTIENFSKNAKFNLPTAP